MKFSINSPKTKNEFEKYYYLRWKILRKPYNKSLGSEKDELENDSFHIFIENKKSDIIGVGRLNLINHNKDAQIRYMAVDENFQKKGYGSILLKELERIACINKVNTIYLNARENAILFYKKNGYVIERKTHLLYNKIQHWLMKKKIF